MAQRGRPTVRVTISPSERTTLEQWARRRTTAQGLAQRAQIVLACALADRIRRSRRRCGSLARPPAAKDAARRDPLEHPGPGQSAGA